MIERDEHTPSEAARGGAIHSARSEPAAVEWIDGGIKLLKVLDFLLLTYNVNP